MTLSVILSSRPGDLHQDLERQWQESATYESELGRESGESIKYPCTSHTWDSPRSSQSHWQDCGRDLEQRILTGGDKKHGWELPAKDTSLQRAPSFQPNTSLRSDFGDSPGWECGEWVSEHPPGKEDCDIWVILTHTGTHVTSLTPQI